MRQKLLRSRDFKVPSLPTHATTFSSRQERLASQKLRGWRISARLTMATTWVRVDWFSLNFGPRCENVQNLFQGVRQELNKHYRRICVNNPLFHGYGIIITIMNCLNHGTTMVLPSPHFNPEDSLKAIVNEKCDICYGTPTSKWLLPKSYA